MGNLHLLGKEEYHNSCLEQPKAFFTTGKPETWMRKSSERRAESSFVSALVRLLFDPTGHSTALPRTLPFECWHFVPCKNASPLQPWLTAVAPLYATQLRFLRSRRCPVPAGATGARLQTACEGGTPPALALVLLPQLVALFHFYCPPNITHTPF